VLICWRDPVCGTPHAKHLAMDELREITRAEIQDGWDVEDADGQILGQVSEVHTDSFSFENGVGGLREVSFDDVESADDGRVILSLSGEELTSDLTG
jgi:hypothetical protein